MNVLEMITTLILEGNTEQATKELDSLKDYVKITNKPNPLSEMQVRDLRAAIFDKELGA